MPTSTSKDLDHAHSGIETTSTGDRLIPQSVRADGSVRKEIKIRPGYRPPEDIEVYKNRTAEAWKTRGQGGIPGADGLKDSPVQQGAGASAKNAKRREARKRAKGVVGETGDEADEQAKATNEGDRSKENGDTDGFSSQQQQIPPIALQLSEMMLDPDIEAEKQARNLKKKLRQARELKEKKESGESLLPEQFAKVIKIQELIRQLDALGFDEDGEKKATMKAG